MSIRGKPVHKRERAESTEKHRNDDARRRYDGGGKSAVLQVVEFGFESARKQYQNNAYLTERVQNFFFFAARFHKKPKSGVFVPRFVEITEKPHDDTRKHHTDYLRKPEFPRYKSETLGKQKDHGEIIKNIDYIHKLPVF